jgi:hypothetical protein
MEGGANGMIKKCVVLNGKVINIGEWDDMNGTNPMPEGATIEEHDFEYDPDHGWYEVGKEGEFEIAELKKQLSETDFKIIKCFEYQFAGLELPYDIQTLHTERQALRDRINELESSLS